MNQKSRQRPLLISCGILQPEIEALIAREEIEPKGPFQNESVRTCSGGGVIRLVR